MDDNAWEVCAHSISSSLADAFMAGGATLSKTKTREDTDHVLIESDRLLIRRPEKTDLRVVEQIFCDAEMMRYLGGPWTQSQTARVLRDWRDDWGIERRWCGVLQHKQTRKTIGTAGCTENTVTGEAGLELSWFVLPAFQRQGFATEITAGILRFGFADLGIARVLAETHPDNHASNGVLEKLGFSRVGEREHTYDDLPGFDRQVLWEQTIENWQGTAGIEYAPSRT